MFTRQTPMGQLVPITVTLLAVAMIIAPSAWGDDPPRTFEHDFRKQPLPAELAPYQVEKEATFQSEPAGLRIKIPKTWTHPWGGVGIKTAFGLKGNFEITAAVEVLHADSPADGFGVGACLFVAAGEIRNGASVARLVRPNEQQVLLWDQTHNSPAALAGTTPCTDKIGRLRLIRMGAKLHYLWAPGTAGDNFQEIHQADFGTELVEYVRLGALNGRTPADVDVRLLALQIRDQLPFSAVVAQKVPRGWLGLGLLIVVVLVLTAGLCTWLIVRRQRRASEVQAPAESDASKH